MEQTEKRAPKSKRVLLWSVAAIAVIAAAGVVGGKIMLEKTVKASLENSGATAGSVDVDFMGRVHLSDVSVPFENDRTLHIASLEARPEFLFMSGLVDASDIEVDAGETQVLVPSLKIEDAGLNRAFVNAVTNKNGLTPSERVEKFSAARIAASKIDVVQSFESSEQKTTYSDVVFNDVLNGHVGSYSASEMKTETQLALPETHSGDMTPEVTNVALHAIEGQNIDAPFLVRVYTEAKSTGEDNAARQVYGPVSAKNLVMDSQDVHITFDTLSSDGFAMRLADQPVLDTLDQLQAAATSSSLSEEDEQRLGLQALSLVDVLGNGNIEISGIEATTAAEPDARFKIADLAFSLKDLTMNFALDGLSLQEGTNSVTLKKASWSDLSLAPTLSGLRDFLESGADAPVSKTALLPAFGTLKMTDYAVHLQPGDETEPGLEIDEPVNFTLKDSSLSLTEPFNGIPTNIQLSIDGLNIDLSDNADNQFIAVLRQLGYDNVVLSENIQAHWDQADEQLVIDDITFGGNDMGRVSLSGVLGGFGEAFFSGDESAIQMAVLGLNAREVKLKLENSGLFSKGLKFYADQNDMSEEQAKTVLAMMPSILSQAVAVDDPGVKTIVDAVSAFIADPKMLEVTVTAKSDQGIGAPAIMSATMDPAAILDQVDITATAE